MRIESGVSKFSPIHIILDTEEERLFFKALGNISKKIARIAGTEGGEDRVLTEEQIQRFADLLNMFWYGPRFVGPPHHWRNGEASA